MTDRTTRLILLMQENRLSPREIAKITGVSPRTVYNWKSPGSVDVIPWHRLELLELRLATSRPDTAEGEPSHE